MDQCEIEAWAAEIRRMAGLGDDELLTGPEIAVRIVGEENVLLCAGRVGARLEGRTIIVPEDHEDISHAFAHELAELVLRDRANFRGTHAEKEQAANAIAAATLAPPSTVRRATAYFGRDIGRLAQVLGLSQTSTHLRLLEVFCEEGAVYTRRRHNVMIRNVSGEIDWQRPHGHVLTTTLPRPPLARTRLHGRPFEVGRIAVRVARGCA